MPESPVPWLFCVLRFSFCRLVLLDTLASPGDVLSHETQSVWQDADSQVLPIFSRGRNVVVNPTRLALRSFCSGPSSRKSTSETVSSALNRMSGIEIAYEYL